MQKVPPPHISSLKGSQVEGSSKDLGLRDPGKLLWYIWYQIHCYILYLIKSNLTHFLYINLYIAIIHKLSLKSDTGSPGTYDVWVMTNGIYDYCK